MAEALLGCTVLVTRPIRQAGSLQHLIEAEGGSAPVLPMIKPVRVSDWEDQIQAAQSYRWDWLVFTSANAVLFFEEIAAENQIPLSPALRVAVVGKKTAEVLREKGWPEPLIPRHSAAEGLADVLQQNVNPGEKVLFPKSARARNIVPQALREAGAELCELPLYTSTPAVENEKILQKWIEAGTLDLLTFTSPSAVQAFVSFLKETPGPLWKELPLVSIGRSTDREAEHHGFVHRKTAETSTMEGIVKELTAWIKEDI